MKGVAVVIKKDEEYLMIQQSKEPYKNHLGLVHGTREVGENEETTVTREVREEVGLDVRIIKKLATTYVDDTETGWWLTEYRDGEIKLDLSEILKAEYFALDHVFSLRLFPPTKEFLHRYKNDL